MDGGNRRPQEVDALFGSIQPRSTTQEFVLDGLHHPQPQEQQRHQMQQEQQNMMMSMHQLYQIEHQRMTILQQLMLQEQRTLLRQWNCQQGNHHEALFMGQGDGVGGASTTINNDLSGLNDTALLRGRNIDTSMPNGPTAGMHRTSQSVTPYLSMQNHRDMDYNMLCAALSSVSNVADKQSSAKIKANGRIMSQSSSLHNYSSPTSGTAEHGITFDATFRERFDRK